jgi:hypothetical protein
MKRQQVRTNMEQMLKLMRQEQELRIELSALDFSMVTEEEFRANMKRQRQLIARIDAIRQQQMLPLMRRMVAFIAAKTNQGATRAAA